MKDYEKTYEPENVTDDEDDNEAEEEEEDNMEVEPDMEGEVVKRRMDKLLKIKESNEMEIARLKSEAEEKDAIAKEKEMIQLGVNNSLEEEKKVLTSRLNRYKEAVPKLRKELEELRDSGKEKNVPNPTKTENNKLKKALKESEDKVEKITMEKVKAESEAKMTARMNSNLEQMLNLLKGNMEGAKGPVSPRMTNMTTAATVAATGDSQARMDIMKRKGKCYKFEKGQCNNESCSFLHPEEVCEVFSRNGVCKERSCLRLHKGEHRGDCYYWKQGSCRYSEEECGKGRHDHKMFDYFNQMKQKQQQQVPAANPGFSSTPAAPFFGVGQGGAVPPPASNSAMTTDQMMAMMQFLSGQLAARREGN